MKKQWTEIIVRDVMDDMGRVVIQRACFARTTIEEMIGVGIVNGRPMPVIHRVKTSNFRIRKAHEVIDKNGKKLYFATNHIPIHSGFECREDALKGLVEYPTTDPAYEVKTGKLIAPDGMEFLFIVPLYDRIGSGIYEHLFLCEGPKLFKPPINNNSMDGQLCIGDNVRWPLAEPNEYINTFLSKFSECVFNSEWPDDRFRNLEFVRGVCTLTEGVAKQFPIFNNEVSANIIETDKATKYYGDDQGD